MVSRLVDIEAHGNRTFTICQFSLQVLTFKADFIFVSTKAESHDKAILCKPLYWKQLSMCHLSGS